MCKGEQAPYFVHVEHHITKSKLTILAKESFPFCFVQALKYRMEQKLKA